ncbi:MAG TPA: NAD(P)/FAD-dependent oxidoreductase [Ktedonobacteraceae bacterium]|nr:NAD(P)/FAD-dependent oxidoreductase [Ktedonobacteraceae bacterium]
MEYAVLGGGALGLATAYRLTQAGQSVVLFEREPEVGGLAAGFQIGASSLEKFYHHIFRTDTTIIRLIQELGLEDHLEWSRPQTVTLIDKKVYQLDSPISLLRYSPLNFIERLRVGATLALFKLSNEEPFEDKTAAPWLRRWMGPHAFAKTFEPLFKGKFGALSEEIALPWFWARIHDRTSSLGYMRGGFQQIYESLAERITQAGGKLHLNTEIQLAEELLDGRWHIKTNRGEWTVDRVISTLPTRLTCRLIPSLSQDYRDRYEWGEVYGAHCLIVGLDRQLTDSYWMNVCDEGYPFTALVEHTNLRPPSEYDGNHLIYLGNYRPMNDPLFKQSKEEVLAEYLPHLKRIRPDFDPSWLKESWMFQAPYAQPIVTTNYRKHIPPLYTPLQGLWMANMFQVYPHDRGQNYSFELAEKLVALLS